MPVLDLKKQDRNIDFIVEKTIEDIDVQKKCYIAELVKKALDKYLDFDDMKADNKYSLYKLPLINEVTDIIDFEINSLTVHVIPTIDKAKNVNVYIPKIYKQYHFKPDIILFVNFSKTLAKMEITGFLTDINLNELSVPKSFLKPGENFINALTSKKINRENKIENTSVDTINELMLAYLENALSAEGRRFFIKHILANKEVRKNYKLFYSFNKNFVSIAQNNTDISEYDFIPVETETTAEFIEEPEQEEEKIDISSRSDYMIDKAISKYEGENAELNIAEDIVQDEIEYNEPEILAEEQTDIMQNTSALLDAEEPELTLNEEPTENLAENIISDITENVETETITESEPIQNETIEENQLILDEEEQELILGEEEFTPLEEVNNTELSFDESQDITDNSEVPVMEEPTVLETQEETFELEDINLEELDGDMLEDLIPEENEEIENTVQPEPIEEEITEPEKDEEPVGLAEEQEAVSEAEELNSDPDADDLFSILSEISDETDALNTNAEDIQPESEPELIMEEEPVMQEITSNPFDNTMQEVAQNIQIQNEQPMEIIGGTEQDIDPNMFVEETNIYAQDNEAQQPYDYQANYEQPPIISKPVNNPKMLVGAFVALLLIGGATLYMNKDNLMSLYGGGVQETAGLEEEKTDAALPPPIDASKLPTTTDETKPATTETAPAPTAVADNAVKPEQTTKPANNDGTNIPPASEAKTLPATPTTTIEPPKARHMNDAIAHALSKDYAGVRISKVSWEVSETLLANPSVKQYLIITGKSLKNALSQDLMAAREQSFNDNVKIIITYRKDGSVADVKIGSSSGSQQIDDLIVKSVKGTLSYAKMPALKLNKPTFDAGLVIRL